MKVKILVPVVGEGICLNLDRVYDLPTKQAKELIKVGSAEAVEKKMDSEDPEVAEDPEVIETADNQTALETTAKKIKNK